MVFKDRSVPSGPKNRSTIIAEGVGECMEGQIGGKSGPGVFRTKQSGLESALGRALVGTKNQLKIVKEGVGECMEGQIGGKSGPGVLRTRQSGQVGALGRAVVGTQNFRPPPTPRAWH